MLIYLIGYMGSGKTTAGKRLANRLGYEFIDLDEWIELHENRTIAEIFDQSGEEYFRQIEQQTLYKTFHLKNSVISTGGGVPCFFDNMDQMNIHGITIYIDLKAKALASRLKEAKNQRPLIKDKSDEELVRFIEEALEKRVPYYSKAKYTVDGLNLSAELLEMITKENL